MNDKAGHRNEITNRAVDALILLNSGACVSLLGFLQAVWKENPELAKPTLYSLIVFATGAACGAAAHLLRVQCSLKNGRWCVFSNIAQLAALFLFLAGAMTMAVGVLCLID